MTDYSELVKALRHCNGPSFLTCRECQYSNDMLTCIYKMLRDAAAAIEELIESVHIRDKISDELNQYIWKLEAEVKRLQKEIDFSESTYDEFQMQAAVQNALLAKQLPKRGEWITKHDGFEFDVRCSICGEEALIKEGGSHDHKCSNYCPNCGAKMNGKEKDDADN